MPKSYTPQKRPNPRTANTPKADTKFHDRNLAAVDPLKEQFEPTDAEPVRQHFKMAGGT